MSAAQLSKVYGFVVDEMLKGYLFDADDLAYEWDRTPTELLLAGVRSIPGNVMNLLIGSACVSKFGKTILKDIPGFISFSRSPLLCDCREFNSPCWCDAESWLLDLDPPLHPHGLLIPETDHLGRAVALRVFRNRKDPNGFLLRSRRKEAA